MIAHKLPDKWLAVSKNLPDFPSLEIDPTLGGSPNPRRAIAIQQRLTKNLLFSFSTDVSQPGSEIVQGSTRSTTVGSVTCSATNSAASRWTAAITRASKIG